jgi:predicted small secreted protein
MKYVRLMIVSVIGVSMALASVACNTVKGAGDDLKGAAEGTERVIKSN